MSFDEPILIAGFGSIGRRHLRNLKTLGYKNFVLYRSGKSIMPDDQIKDIPVEYDLKKAFAYKPKAVIIANPTSMHMRVAIEAANFGAHLFIEKPISHTMDGVKELLRLVKKKRLLVQVGFQYRFHPLLQKVKSLLDDNVIGSVTSVQAHWGEYLPNWHPGEDYKESYSANEKLGGGVILTLSHPFDYLRWLFGDVESVSALAGKTGGLEIDVEDTADILLNFKSGVIGSVHLDYLEQPAEHFMRIIGQNGVIIWDNLGFVKWYKEGKWKELKVPEGFERNKLYLDEMAHFLSCINKNEQPLCTLDDGINALRIALAAKQSAREGSIIKLT